MSRCGQAIAIAQAERETVFHQLRCKSWNCPHCRHGLRKRLYSRAMKGKPDRMMTLTVQPGAFSNPGEAARALVDAWRRMRQELRRRSPGRKLPFLAVFERHKSGWPHLHILLRGSFISQAWASDYMRRRLGAPVVDIRRFKSARMVAGYVSKYVAKDPSAFEGAKRSWSNPAWRLKRWERARRLLRWQLSRQPMASALIIATVTGEPPQRLGVGTWRVARPAAAPKNCFP